MTRPIDWFVVATCLAAVFTCAFSETNAEHQNIEKRSLARTADYYPEDEFLEDGELRWRPEPIELLVQFNGRTRREAEHESYRMAEEAGEEELHRERRGAPSLIHIPKAKLNSIAAAAKKLLEQKVQQRKKAAAERKAAASKKHARQGKRRKFNKNIKADKNARLNRMLKIEADEKAILTKYCVTIKQKVPPKPVCTPATTGKYRTVDGSCNSVKHPTWGKTLTRFVRLLEPVYESRGAFLPRLFKDPKLSPRKVSDVVFENDITPAGEMKDATILLTHWGQFVDHDITHTPAAQAKCDCKTTNEACAPVPIAPDDKVFKSLPKKCFEVPRSLPFCDNTKGWHQFNDNTAFLDASTVYGSATKEAKNLRFHSVKNSKTPATAGRLRVQDQPLGQNKEAVLPHQTAGECFQEDKAKGIICGEAGDFRANEHPGLIALHTTFLRLHNTIAGKLDKMNPAWSDEVVFQEARKLVGAIIQRITYEEYLPVLFGKTGFAKHIGAYKKYNENANPSIANVFATAAFRMGHSSVGQVLERWKVTKAHEQKLPDLQIDEAFFNAFYPYDFAHGGLDAFIEGMVRQKSRKIDTLAVKAIQRRLFVAPKHPTAVGLDLIAINIDRGRDHGIPPYHQWRKHCKFPDVTKWSALKGVMTDHTIAKLKKVYGAADSKVQIIDAFVGFLGEEPHGDSLIGPTLSCLVGAQFKNLRDGDRFFYLNKHGQQAFTAKQQKAIQDVSLARVFCDTMDDPLFFQFNVFKHTDMRDLNKDKKPDNPVGLCADHVHVKLLNLQPWKI